MGLKLTSPLRCGRCGKRRGITHTCVTSMTSRRRGRTSLRNPAVWTCGTCGQPRGLNHTCRQRSDFKQRRRKQAADERRRKRKAAARKRAARRKQAAADRRARERARRQAAKRKQGSPRRRTREAHEPGSCGDRDCEKYGCKAYWRGMGDCPLPHEGD